MDLSAALLAWYDRHARKMPWRVPPGSPERADPYRVWLSEVMLQQTTVAAATAYWERFVLRWPRVEDLAAAPDADVMAAWAGLGYYARARNLLATARAVAGSPFPTREADLLRLPGIGPYTAAAVAAIAGGERAVVVDGNVERVMTRLHDIATPLPQARVAIRAAADALTPAHRPGDHAQAVMDLGATICTPRNPACGLCPWREPCLARRRGTQALRPVKPPKRAVLERTGVAYVGRRADGLWLLETRDASRMLGGTLGWPDSRWDSSAWDRDGADPGPPAPGEWARAGAVRHGFTHFGLTLEVRRANLPLGASPRRGAFQALDPTALPTLMRRAWEAAGAPEAAPGAGPAVEPPGALL
jgi:A/G-specific adenine glycosylase